MTRTSQPSTPAGPPLAGDAPADELLIDGQEEVFSRTEVESGRIEHHAGAGSGSTDGQDGVEPVKSSRRRP
jgi:hypothetical protein